MNFQPILLTILAGSIALLDMSALAQSKPATPPAKAPTKAASAKETAKKPATKDAALVVAPVIETEKSKSVYIVPMGIEDKGQFGLDIHPQVYEQIAKDITEKRPDIVVFILNSADISSVRYLGDDPRKFGLFDDDGIRKMTRDLKEVIEKVGAESIMIVRDAVGYSVLLGLSWPNMYMTDSARLMGLERIQERTKAEDPEVYAKFREAMVGICNGFLISGGYDPNIGMAMMREEKLLSASFKGREIVWSDDDKGTWVVDGSKEKITAHFNSEMAEDLGLSDGTVSDDGATMIEDLMYLRGTRNYERLPKDGEILVRQYIDGWRKGLEDCVKSYTKYQEALGEAQGKDEKKNLSKAKGILAKVLSIVKKYPAVEMRLRQQGISRLEIETELLRLQDRIRGLGKSTAPPSGGGGKGKGGGLGVGSNITDSQ
ncbi:MAG: hypothetical protein O3B75_00335 [Planctomycetota bacterium]|nr:hypothetical protein [Planctomycetota bacterium]